MVLARSTRDIDVLDVAPAPLQILIEAGGKGCPIALKHGVYLDVVTGIVEVPWNYDERFVPFFEGQFQNLRLYAMDPYDIVLTKIKRSTDRGFGDMLYLAKSVPLAPDILRDRYEKKWEPYITGDKREPRFILHSWIEAIRESQSQP